MQIKNSIIQRAKIIIQILCLSLILTGCSNDTIKISDTPASGGQLSVESYPSSSSEAYPAPLSASQDVVPPLLDSYPEPLFTPMPSVLQDNHLTLTTPNEGYGVVTGKLVTSDPNQAPYLATIYLGRTIPANQPGYPPIVALSEETDPKADQDNTGTFYFNNITPGTYALIIWTPVSSFVIEESDTKEHMLFEVKANEITNLGTIIIP